MINLQLFDEDSARMTALKQTLLDLDLMLAGMYHEYEMCTDGRMEMMQSIKPLRDELENIRYELRDHKRTMGKILTMLNEIVLQRAEAIHEREQLRVELVKRYLELTEKQD